MGGNRNANNFVIHKKFDGGKRDFYYHDDRVPSQNYKKDFNEDKYFNSDKRDQYQFKRGNYRGSKYRGRGSKNIFNNDDDPMTDRKSRFQHMYVKGRGGRMGGRGRGGMSVRYTPMWNKIILKDAASYPKEEVIMRLKELVEDEFVPVMMEIEAPNLVFYLEKKWGVAKAIENLSGRLVLGKKHKISIVCTEKTPPERNLTEPQIEIIKNVMAARFSIEMNRLDLKKFHEDKTLNKEHIFCPLYRRQCLDVVMDITLENCSHVEEIDLSWNGLFNGYGLPPLKKCINLKRLYLERNKLKSMGQIDSLKGLGITDLSLEGNPLCDHFKDAGSYVNAVRNLFPRVERLDGMDLPKPITFEVEEENANLPATKPSFFCSEDARRIVVEFVQQYYQIFESADRTALQAAYTEEALFSLSSYISENVISGRNVKWIEYENRNMKRIFDPEKRDKLLYKGRENITKILCKMPPLTHDPNSFVIDIPFAKPCLMHVTVTGVFKQIGDKNPVVRNFMKSLVIVPVGSGFCISNEEFFINAATIEQIRNAFKEPETDSTPSTSGVASSSDPLGSLDQRKAELVKSFAVNTKMLPQYCIMCLENNNWNFQKAGEMFLSLQSENKIPPEYFGAVA